MAGAFHSRLMEPAADKLRQALISVGVQKPHYLVPSNVTGVYHTDSESIRQRLVEQLTHSVNWIGCVETMAKSGIKTYLKIISIFVNSRDKCFGSSDAGINKIMRQGGITY